MATDTRQSGTGDKLGRIVYMAHGPDRYHDQLCFSLLTFLDLMLKAGRSDIECVVFSDRPERVPAHALVHVIPLSTAELKAWRGPLDFVLRTKLEALRYAIRQFGAPILFVDTDTRWLRLPVAQLMELGSRRRDASQRMTFYMHVNEGNLSAQFHPRYFRSLSSDPAVRRILSAWGTQTTWTMWNSGAIGTPVGAEDFFERALRLCDELLLRLRPRTYVEQLALSLLAARDFTVKPIDDCIHHYWGVSAEFERVLRSFLPEIQALPTEEQARRAGAHEWDESRLRGGQHAPAHRWKTRFAKMRNSIHKRRMDLKALFLRFKT